MAMIDVEGVSAIIRDVAAQEILPRYLALGTGDVREKQDANDLVTVADIEAERSLTRRLSNTYPGTMAFGEEGATTDPSLLRLLDADRPVWVIDPVDGTFNFAHGRPGFAVIVAYVRNGVTLAGWIHDPLRQLTITAVRGRGAWHGASRLTVAAAPSSLDAIGAAYGNLRAHGTLADILNRSGRFATVSNLLSGAIEYIGLVEEQRHFLVADRSFPWDHAAGVLIVQEAGGTAGFLDGADYDPRIVDRHVMVETSRQLWNDLQSAIGTDDGVSRSSASRPKLRI